MSNVAVFLLNREGRPLGATQIPASDRLPDVLVWRGRTFVLETIARPAYYREGTALNLDAAEAILENRRYGG